MVGDGLGNDLPVLPFGLRSVVGYMLSLMRTDGIRGGFRIQMGGVFEGDAGVIGPVFIGAVFAGLAFVCVVVRLPGRKQCSACLPGFGQRNKKYCLIKML